jgi:hypothetical protein
MKKVLVTGIVAGLAMGLALMITGAIAAYVIYGPQMAPDGKFEQNQMNAVYFLWTKLVIGLCFGLLFTFVFGKIQAGLGSKGVWQGILYAVVLWFLISLWAISHPLVYEGAAKVASKDQVFWHIYTLGGFLGYGLALGLLGRKRKAASV